MFVFSPRSCCFLLSLDKRHAGWVPRLCKPRLPRQELRSLKCALFSSFLPASLLSLMVTSALGPMPTRPALTPQYTQPTQPNALRCTQCCNIFPNRVPANRFVYGKNHLALSCYFRVVPGRLHHFVSSQRNSFAGHRHES